ncbi:MAG: flagellar basal body-associated FliL family protein [Treponema sp.]|jgi:flagellar FliL protein|nr:flagellar basal body-associated FliL family protein [Treponema sp.]
MSDTDDIDLEGGDSPGIEGSKKKGGLGNLLPNLLKFIAMGLGALAFIVTVAVITYQFMSGGGKSQTMPAGSAIVYEGKQPEYSMFTSINQVMTRTKDVTPYSVVVDMVIGYDLNDKNAQTELTSRLYQLQDFVRFFFSGKTRAELLPQNEDRLKQEIVEHLNTRLLNSSKVRIILFRKLDVMEMM